MIKELSEKDFDSFIKKGNAVVDFWAEWCVAPNTVISTSPIHSKLASNIDKNDNIISFNNGLLKDTISYSKRSAKAGHCKKITSSSGRVIETTDDHAFYTQKGWKAAQDLVKEDKIAILPVVDYIPFDGEDKILLQKSDFEYLREEYKNLDKYTEELKNLELLPLRKDNPKILIFARLIGALFSDGNLYKSKKNNYREISFTLGQQRDVDEVIKDLTSLGFSILHISEKNNKCEINGRKFTLHTLRVKCLSTALYLLMKALGVPESNKTNQKYNVPHWIKNGELSIKKEFLSAYLGGDGPKLSMVMVNRANKKPYNCLGINDIEFHKRTDILDSGLSLAENLKSLLMDFRVETKIFYEIDPYIRRDKTQAAIIHVEIMNNFNNAFILSQKIGYSYCWQKQLSSMSVGAFVRRILYLRDKWKDNYNKAMKMAQEGINYKEISNILGIDDISVYNWIIKKIHPTINKHNIKFDEWLNESTEGLKDGVIWERVESVEETYIPEVQILTTKKNHNFIANGFLVHNCGPCKMMEPQFKKAAETIKGVKFGKVDVDQEYRLSERFDVRSIPTTIFFKDGEVVDQHTGAMTADMIKRMADEAFS